MKKIPADLDKALCRFIRQTLLWHNWLQRYGVLLACPVLLCRKLRIFVF